MTTECNYRRPSRFRVLFFDPSGTLHDRAGYGAGRR